MSALPIIFFHSGKPEYLKYSLKQAKHFNPGAPVYLIGDKSNDGYSSVTHVNLNSLTSAKAEQFKSIYEHRSPNSENYELNCFLRWFYIEAFCERHGMEGFFYLDSDVLLFQDLSELRPYFGDSDIANTCDFIGMPAVSYFKDKKAIGDFCDFLIHAYTDVTAIQKLEEWYDKIQTDMQFIGGISDMVLFHLYFLEHPDRTLKIDLLNDKLAVDVSINYSDGYEYEDGMKKIYWQNGMPYGKHLASGKLMRFVSLHYQGTTKNVMRQHYKAGGYKLQRLWEPYEISAKIKRVKQAMKSVFKK